MSLNYLFKRLLNALLIFIGVASVVFFLFNVLPSDPARLLMGQRSDEQSIKNARQQLRLDEPLINRYVRYINDLSPIGFNQADELNHEQYCLVECVSSHAVCLQMPNLGMSYTSKMPVTELLWDALPGTILLALAAMFLATIIGVGLGVIAALYKDRWPDQLALSFSVIGIALPSFFAALLLAYLLGYLLEPLLGLSMTGSYWAYTDNGERYFAVQNVLLPMLALCWRPVAIITQLTRSATLDAMQMPYMTTAIAKGLSRNKAVLKHALPNALNPVITAVSGWLAELLVGSFFVEFVFGWKGLGKLTVDALDKMDFPLVMGAVLFAALIFIVINFLTDILYTWIDPRIRLT